MHFLLRVARGSEPLPSNQLTQTNCAGSNFIRFFSKFDFWLLGFSAFPVPTL